MTTKTTYQKHTPTKFYKKWGITAEDLANQEGVTVDAIHMRIMHYGTPWQRRGKPSIYEIVYGKTCEELCRLANLSPQTIRSRMKKGASFEELMAPTTRKLKSKELKSIPNSQAWLHPNHSEYATWREKWQEKYPDINLS